MATILYRAAMSSSNDEGSTKMDYFVEAENLLDAHAKTLAHLQTRIDLSRTLADLSTYIRPASSVEKRLKR